MESGIRILLLSALLTALPGCASVRNWYHGHHGGDQGGAGTAPASDTQAPGTEGADQNAPPRVIDTALRAVRAIGPGLYGVDIKETDGEIVVIEVNDNPNLEHGVEDLIGKDEVWTRILNWFIKRIGA